MAASELLTLIWRRILQGLSLALGKCQLRVCSSISQCGDSRGGGHVTSWTAGHVNTPVSSPHLSISEW